MKWDVRLKLICFCFLFSPMLHAQIGEVCSGNLGENIFTDGDFGEGSLNIPSTDPGIAPGYSYTRNGPPFDGFYTITNDMSRWQGLFGTWLGIGDNSTNPNGYMMVVNADFSPGLFYEEVIDGLCENTLFEFSADVINLIRQGVTDHIKPNVSFLLDDEVVLSTGDIPQDNRWHTYGITFETKPGQTSLKLSLRNNAPGGIGNDLALDNISFRACGPEALILPREIANICEDGDPIPLEATIIGDQYPNPSVQWQQSLDGGLSWTNIPGANSTTIMHNQLQGGFYDYRYLLAATPENLANGKCRVVSNVKTVHVVPKFYSLTDSICQGLSYTVGPSTYTETGVYTDSLLTSIGCDSIVTLNLIVLPDQNITADLTVTDPNCSGEANASIMVNQVSNAYAPYDISIYNFRGKEELNTGLLAGNYKVEIIDRFGCQGTIPVSISDPPLFTISLGADTAIRLGDPLLINPSANYNITQYIWTPDDINCGQDSCQSLSFFPLQSDLYKLEAVTERGCRAIDSIQIEVLEHRAVFMPNAFSPNGDGVNDYFTVYGNSPLVKQVEKLSIFDRWGNLIFETGPIEPNNPVLGWDGRQGADTPASNIYVYQALVRFIDEKIFPITGDILLIR